MIATNIRKEQKTIITSSTLYKYGKLIANNILIINTYTISLNDHTTSLNEINYHP